MVNWAAEEAAKPERPKGAERPLFLCDKNGCPEDDEGSRSTQQLLFSSSNLRTLRAGVHWRAFPEAQEFESLL
jgi:hypothetical protein